MQIGKNNQISWEYWNDKEKELAEKNENEKNEENEEDFFSQEKDNPFSNLNFNPEDNIIVTPFFQVKKNSAFKPSDRWECWIGHTNFKIDEEFLNFLNLEVDGLGCLNILDTYCFAIGVAKLFSFESVRLQIERKIKGSDEVSGSDQQ